MAVQYSPLPELQVPNVNLLGAYAQGAALQQNRFEQEKALRAMELAGVKSEREEEAARLKQQADELDFAVKNANIFRDRVMQISPTDPKAQDKYDALIGEFQPKAPSILGGLPTTFNADTQRSIVTQHDDFMKMTAPHERETMVDGRPGKAMFIFDPYTQSERMVSGSFQGGALPDVKVGDMPYRQTAPGQLSEYTVGAPPSRGQVGVEQAPETALGGTPMSSVKQGFSRVESGGNYSAIGPDVKRKNGVDRAYGKYQVMGANIPAWTKQALGKSLTVEEFLASPEAQERVFEDQITRNFKKYGTIEDAASVWFSGRPLAQATKAGARDVNMSAPEYVQRVTGGMGPVRNMPTVPLTGERPSLRALPEQPINAMAPAAAAVNAMAMPAPTPAPTNVAPGLTEPMPLSQAVKAPLKRQNTKIFSELLSAAENMESAGILPKMEGEGIIARAKKVGAAELPASMQRVIDPKAEKLRTGFTNIIDRYLQQLRESKTSTAGEVNTIKELEAKKAMLGTPGMTIEELRDIITGLDADLGTGTLKSGARSETKTEAARPVTVNVPGHGVVTFPSQEAADAFKREAGL